MVRKKTEVLPWEEKSYLRDGDTLKGSREGLFQVTEKGIQGCRAVLSVVLHNINSQLYIIEETGHTVVDYTISSR